jgi:hypothetical protein
LVIFVLLLASIILPIDYGVSIPLLSILFYFIEKVKNTFMIKTEIIRNQIGRVIKLNEYKIVHIIYVLLLFGAIALCLGSGLHIYSLAAIIPLALYNGERGKKSKVSNLNFHSRLYTFTHKCILIV